MAVAPPLGIRQPGGDGRAISEAALKLPVVGLTAKACQVGNSCDPWGYVRDDLCRLGGSLRTAGSFGNFGRLNRLHRVVGLGRFW